MELKDRLIGQQVRRVVISLKKESCGYLHVFSIFEQIDKDMQDYEDFAPNNGNEYNDFDRTAKGKGDKLFITVDKITITEDLYEQPWKDYYSGKDLLQTTTDEYHWPLGKENWGVIPSDDNNNVELKTLLPRRYCPRFVRYCMPKKQTEALSNILKNEKLRVQFKELTIRNLGYDLTEHSLYLGGFIFLAYNDIYSRIDFTEKGTQDGIFCRVAYKNDNRQPLKVVCRRKGNDGCVIDETSHILDGSRNLYELDFGKTFHTLEVNIFDQNGNLLDFYNNLVFIHSIHFDMRVGDSEVHVNDEEGNTIKTVQKYIEDPRTVIGDKNPKGLLDSSPEYAYRKFEEALDFVFYDGDKEQSEENIRRAENDILRIIDSAKDRAYICDVFFDVKSLARFVLPMACRLVPVKILSGKKELKQDGKREKLASTIKEFNEKGIAKVECRLLIGKKAELHDRFIVADDNVWMLGCSLNEFGNRATTLIRVPKDYKQKLIDRALEWWNDETLTVDIYDVEEKVNTKRKCFICKWFDKLCRW